MKSKLCKVDIFICVERLGVLYPRVYYIILEEEFTFIKYIHTFRIKVYFHNTVWAMVCSELRMKQIFVVM